MEWNESDALLEERALRLGKSILLPMVKSIRKVKQGEILTEDYELSFECRAELEEFLAYLRRQGVLFIVEEQERLDEGIKVKIRRLRNSSTDKIKSVLSGRGE